MLVSPNIGKDFYLFVHQKDNPHKHRSGLGKLERRCKQHLIIEEKLQQNLQGVFSRRIIELKKVGLWDQRLRKNRITHRQGLGK
jgi:Txe/YoeB family toxin of Txe-Axe toxin-antitoxin module